MGSTRRLQGLPREEIRLISVRFCRVDGAEVSDSPAFSPSAYYEDLVRRASLVELMQTAVKFNAGMRGRRLVF